MPSTTAHGWAKKPRRAPRADIRAIGQAIRDERARDVVHIDRKRSESMTKDTARTLEDFNLENTTEVRILSDDEIDVLWEHARRH